MTIDLFVSMGAFTSYLLYFASLFFTDSTWLPPAMQDSIPYEELLLKDTLQLHLASPPFETSFFKDGIIFLSTIHEGIGWVPLDHPDISERKALFANSLKSHRPTSITFTEDGHASYFSTMLRTPGVFSLEKIFEMSIDSSYSSGLKQLDFTHDSCRYLHPALSSNDSMLVFSSDRLPTRGGLDLFVSRRDSAGWSEPEPLDPSINSAGHERYPFLDHMNNLWFSSTGHSSDGNYDIYICPFNGKNWEPPRKLGPVVNTSQDETGFSLHSSGQVALFTRRSPSEEVAIRIRKNEKTLENQAIKISNDWDIPMILLNLAQPPADPVNMEDVETASEPISQADTVSEKPIASHRDAANESQQVIFRVQILSSVSANTTPSVVIEGSPYETFEYFYKGAYRITVGKFENLQDANNFRLQCRRAGFNQAFVAAFRGEKRETDPSVFKD
jgi:hypothetical protein